MRASPRLRLASAALALCLGAAGSGLAADPNEVLPDGPGKDVVVHVCTGCHEASQLTYKRRSSEDWDYMIGKMIDGGAELTAQEQDTVHAYLVKNFGPPAAAAAPASDTKTPGR